MRSYLLVLTFLAASEFRCAQSPKLQEPKTNQNSSPDPTMTSSGMESNLAKLHFFSVAWGCVEVEQAKLDAAAYLIQDYKTEDGPCPGTLPVLDQIAQPLLTCPVKIVLPAISANYVLYDKRALGSTVDDLKKQGFSQSNFCPAIFEKNFR